MTVFYSVLLKTPYLGKTDYFFGSIAGIYQVLPAAIIGCKASRLYALSVAMGKVFENDKCTIKQELLVRKKTKRGKK